MNDRIQQRSVLLATSLSYVVVILDTSIVNVALGPISMSLAGGMSGLQWVVNAYTLTFASLLLSGGTLGDRLGARNVYIAGLAVFTGASALCGAASSLAALIGARVLQGVGAALLVPASLALINRACPHPQERAAAFGVWAGLGGLAMAAGPLIGGVLIGLAGWRSIFLLNVPVCLIGIVLARRVEIQAGARSAAAPGFDIAGQIAAIATLALLNITVIGLPAYGWFAPPIAAGCAATLVAGCVFVAIETKRAQPMLPFGLFRHSGFSCAILVSMVSAFTFYGLMFDLSLYFQHQLGYSPMRTGLAFLPLTIVVPIGSFLSKRAVTWLGPRSLVGAACVLAALGFAGLWAIVSRFSAVPFAFALPAIGLAASLITPVATTTLMASVESVRSGIAAGVLNAARQTGAVLGVTVSGSMIAMRHSIVDGMRSGLLLAGALSFAAGMAWWFASMQAGEVGEGVSGELHR
ncbi:MFS transporter [Paraburkholderia susongensis]|uniref:MFS transporter, DHA2 family, methylenomycin A resistance protein n=1 Tax=Paraburkholderia susongensis TaxID=1515439 RepID=A0A1X7L9S0_9BURK|nr:MFS transporter [Paraburkholderia susongensis]SMG50571.1 MFS transporter, DHA2 family, methylenomycin A resistance protein [Paraburkholderia susongensis]